MAAKVSVASVEDEEEPKPLPFVSRGSRKISFPADSVLSAVVSDGDICELLSILRKCPRLDLNQSNYSGLTALHHGVLCNNLDAIKVLVGNGADVNSQDTHGFSPLHTAAACGYMQITSLLLLNGADVFLLTQEAEMPIDVAKDIHVIRLLAEQMYLHIHRDTYIPAYLLRILKGAYSTLSKLSWSFYRNCCDKWRTLPSLNSLTAASTLVHKHDQ